MSVPTGLVVVGFLCRMCDRSFLIFLVRCYLLLSIIDDLLSTLLTTYDVMRLTTGVS